MGSFFSQSFLKYSSFPSPFLAWRVVHHLMETRLDYLFRKYFDKTASPEERAELAKLVDESGREEELFSSFTGVWEEYKGEGEIIKSERAEEMLTNILGQTPAPAKVVRFGWKRVAVAAVLLFAALAAVWLLLPKHPATQPVVSAPVVPLNIPPGSNGAILTLDNGQRVVLDSAHNGVVAQQGAVQVTKKGDKLVYEGRSATEGETVYNTISTPRGKQYPNLVLADGTKVWLDAGSSIRFPVTLAGAERRVEVSGQVWFDVFHDAKRPFKVLAGGVEISDIGTQFNVNAYKEEEGTRVTLLQGAVRIGDVMLRPGQQARVPSGGRVEVKNDVDVEQVMAWKNGFFYFKDADIQTVMRQLSRWYDVDVVYEGKADSETFTGKIGRGLTLRDLLDGLAKTRVHYHIDSGNKLVILP